MASLCTIVWAISQPGFLHTLCLNIMLVASVNTLLFNGNLLRRYDGYYIFSDLVEVPNLAQRAQALLRRTLGRVLFGIETPRAPETKPGLAADVCRRFDTLPLVSDRRHSLVLPSRAETARTGGRRRRAHGSDGCRLFVPLSYLRRTSFATPARAAAFDRGCAFFTADHVGDRLSLLIASCRPRSPVDAVATLQPADAQRVYAAAAGILRRVGRTRDQVAKGQFIARLENPELDASVERLRGELNTARQEHLNIEARLLDDPPRPGDSPVARNAERYRTATRRRARDDEEELTLRARGRHGVAAPVSSRVAALPTTGDLVGLSAGGEKSRLLSRTGHAGLPGRFAAELESILLIDETEIPFVQSART